MFRNFRGHIFVCFVYSKNLKHYEKRLQQAAVPDGYKKRSSLEFLKTHRKTPLPESLFDEVVGFQPAT